MSYYQKKSEIFLSFKKKIQISSNRRDIEFGTLKKIAILKSMILYAWSSYLRGLRVAKHQTNVYDVSLFTPRSYLV